MSQIEAEPKPATHGRLLAPARAVFGALGNFLLPPVCIHCRAPVDRHAQVCGACWSGIDFITAPFCDKLGIPLPYDAGGDSVLSAAALASPPAYDRARAVAAYAGTMRDLIQSFKYHDRHEGLDLFAGWLAKAGAELLQDADLLVPVPLHRAKLWSRRFNQSALLAQRVGRQSGLPAALRLLARVRRTASQVGLSADQRRRNVSGAFRVDGKRSGLVTGGKIILVDDVITTGATAEACARALKRAGAARVDVLALARVVEPAAFSL